jgi:SWI/SNF-related matrix-associated actin-dependent regulator 1 of chromatin subfamily A
MPTALAYQDEGVKFILSHRGTLLADDMGLGKTAQTILAFSRSDSSQLTVICPAYLKTNWQREFKDWLPGYDPKRLKLSSYEGAHALSQDSAHEFLTLDEGHYLKTPTSQRYATIAPMAKRARKLVILTGTPIPNRVRELWPLLAMLDANRWDPPYRSPFAGLPSNVLMLPAADKKEKGYTPAFFTFAKRFCGAKLIETTQKHYIDRDWRFKKAYDFDGSSNLEELRRILRQTVMLRRTKAEVLKDLPPKRRQLIVFPIQKGVLNQEIDSIEVNEESYDRVVKSLESDKVKFAKWSETRHKQARDKIPLVLDHLSDCLESGSQKIIVFAHHQDVIEELYARLMFDGAVMAHGGHNQTWRDDAIDTFQQDPNCKFFIGSLGACGTGINLTAASHVVFAEFDPRPYAITQAEDRAHRLGQRNMVLVQHLLWDGTLDAKMAQIVVKKQRVIHAVLA